MKNKIIPVIDLFAGPGGLAEGFSQYKDKNGWHVFRTLLSIEMEESAHMTLALRSYVHKFIQSNRPIPEVYYDFIEKGKILNKTDLITFLNQSKEGIEALNEAHRLTLGKDNQVIDDLIEEKLSTAETKEWVLIGGPPCQAYSIAGRVRNKTVSGYVPENDKRQYLYEEYLRIIAKFKPTVFVMENVKGLLSASLKGKSVFKKIIQDLELPEYAIDPCIQGGIRYRLFSLSKEIDSDSKPQDYIVKSEFFGIPQKRHRVIILGVREDIQKTPATLKSRKQVNVSHVLQDLIPLVSRISRKGLAEGSKNSFSISNIVSSLPTLSYSDLPLKSNITEKDFNLIRNEIHAIGGGDERNIPRKVNDGKSSFLKSWYHDFKLKGPLNHIPRSHMLGDLHRYLYASCFAKITQRSPSINEFPICLLPNHKNIKKNGQTKNFTDRFKVQLATTPSSTITSHIAKDGHYYIHFDPTQCRSLTVREAARLQTFPDNYFFCGNTTQQYHQVGNAVPPYLAYQVAGVIYDTIIADLDK
jgi:DNA (cytosine-5)-methyltransferase 1